jgi:hypothetical protein
MVATTTIVLSGLITSALAVAEPAVTAAAELQPRQYAVNPVLVGYISASDGCTSQSPSFQPRKNKENIRKSCCLHVMYLVH